MKSRGLFIGLVTLAILIVVYLLYSTFNQTPPIELNTVLAPDANEPTIEFEEQVGQVGEGVGLGSVQKAYFFDLNPKTEKLEREFGFLKLLHEEGDVWEIEKPYMTVYKDDLTCSITADFGTVLLEGESAKPSPKDATLKGNVVIHIEPKDSSKTKPSTIYLDKVVFIGKKSQFSTSGPVHFVNPDAEMKGTGMELIYNQQLERLEILKIVKLQTLKIKTDSQASLFSSDKEDKKKKTVKQEKQPVKSVAKKVQVKPVKDKPVIKKTEPVEPSEDTEKYKCILNNNVVIDCPEQVIFADNIVIDNIKSGSSKDKQSSEITKIVKPKKTSKIKTNLPSKQVDVDQNMAQFANQAAGPTGPKLIQVPNPQDVFTDNNDTIVVTCDGGIIFMPVDAALEVENNEEVNKVAETPVPEKFSDSNDYRAKFLAGNIHYDVDTEKTVAKNDIKLLFYHTERITPDSNERIKLPVTVSASDKVEFWPVDNKVVFEGSCLCQMRKPQSGFMQNYNLSGNQLIIDLETEDNDDDDASDTGIRHLRAIGGTVRLSSVKNAETNQLGGVELKCRQFDYTTKGEKVVATGPDGMIKVDNSNIAMPQSQTKTVALKKPCWAIVQNFQSLKYSPVTNELNIRSEVSDTLRIDYIPIDPDKGDQHIISTANSLDVKMTEKSELLTLHAFGGVTYDEQQPLVRNNKKTTPINFEANEFLFESIRSLITAKGTEKIPGRINSSPFEVIKYDLETGRVIKAKFDGPMIF